MPSKSEPLQESSIPSSASRPGCRSRVERSDCLALTPLRCRQERPPRRPQEAVEPSEPSTQGPRLCPQALGSGFTDETPSSTAVTAPTAGRPGPQSLSGAVPSRRLSSRLRLLQGVRGWVPHGPPRGPAKASFYSLVVFLSFRNFQRKPCSLFLAGGACVYVCVPLCL